MLDAIVIVGVAARPNAAVADTVGPAVRIAVGVTCAVAMDIPIVVT